jgi:hypothetical protein
MKKALLIVLIALAACKEKTASNDAKPEAPDVKPEFLLTDRGLHNLKLGMKVEDAEKMFNQQFPMKNAGEMDSWLDTAKATYHNIPMELYFERMYVTDTEYEKVLSAFKFSSPEIKTDKNISVGSEFLDIVKAYDGYIMNIYPEFEDTTYTKRSKTKSMINVGLDDSEVMLVFSLDSKKVTAIEVTRNYGEH